MIDIVAAIAINANREIQKANFPLLNFILLIFLIFYMNKKHEILPLKDTELIIKISNIYW
jgi:hypothetical protein